MKFNIGDSDEVKKTIVILILLRLVGLKPSLARAQDPKDPPLSKYITARDDEMAQARRTAPANISDRATIKVLTPSGYRVAREKEMPEGKIFSIGNTYKY